MMGSYEDIDVRNDGDYRIGSDRFVVSNLLVEETTMKARVMGEKIMSKVKLNKAEIDHLLGSSKNSARGHLYHSVKPGELTCTCRCGRNMKISKDDIDNVLQVHENVARGDMLLEGELTSTVNPGDLVFVVTNPNGHSYPFATMIIFGANRENSTGLFLQDGTLRVGNNLPLAELYRPTRIHTSLVPRMDIFRRLLEVSGVEIFGKVEGKEKRSVSRKSSRDSKTRVL